MTEASIANIMSSDSSPSRLVDSPSPYSHLLGTPVAFSGRPEDLALKAELAAFVGVVDTEIAQCRRKVDDLRAALLAAEQDLAAAEAFRDLHVSIFPPIHTLPTELLTKIFKLVVGCDLTPLSESARAGPWALRNVCTFWRHTAESEPRLWCCFELYLGPGKLTTKTQELAAHRAIEVLLTNTLRWSGSRKLDFSVDLRLFLLPSLDSSQNTSVTLPTPLKELFATSARWRSVILHNIGWVFSRVAPLEIGDLSNLRSLTLREVWATTVDGLEEDWAHDYDPVALKMFAKTPRLRSLRIIAPSKPMVWDNLDWSRLDQLFLDLRLAEHPIVLVSYRFLETCPQLTHYYEVNGLSLEGSQSYLISKPTILLPRLQVLHLLGLGVLCRLQCPQLKRLILPALESTHSVDMVVDFLKRSASQSLERVHLRVANQVTAHSIRLLPNMPSVRELTIEAGCRMDLVLRVFHYLSAHLQVVPQLQGIDLMLDLQFAIPSRPCAVELLQHVFTRTENSKLDRFSIQLFSTARSIGPRGIPEAPIYDAGPNSLLHGFLSVLREAHIPQLKITVDTKLQLTSGTPFKELSFA